MRKRTFLSAGVAATLLATGGIIGGAGTALAAGDPTYYFEPVDAKVLQPGEGWAELSSPGGGGMETGQPDGTFVYALSKKPLTDAAWTGGGAPAGLTVDPTDSCTPKAGKAGVYLCDVTEDGYLFPAPEVRATATAADNTTAYYALVYVPRGASVDAGIKQAQTAATQPIGDRRAHSTITVKTRAHVARNTMKPTVPTLPGGGTVQHTVKLHAVDTGRLDINLAEAPGERRWDDGELKVDVTGVDAGGAEGAVCDHSLGEIGWGGIWCEISAPGDYTITYGLRSDVTTPAWKLRATTVYEVYDFGTGNPEATADFGIASPIPVIPRYQLIGRTPGGDLYFNVGSGRSPRIFSYSDLSGATSEWAGYSAATRLGPLTVQSTGAGAVGRDRNGVLWSYAASGDGGLFDDRRKVGGGWQVYDALVGAGDLTGDGKADLLARDASGTLWLYRGTGNRTAPFATRARVGGGWQIHAVLTGGTDLTRDGKADLLARDKAGVLWLYPGRGNGTFGARVQVGGGWQGYTSLVSPGDLNSDGKADLVARDAAGTLWYYQGSGTATRPFATRVKVGGGWNRYNLLF
ncbi:FG-GAP repeat domain-containing protein [Streptomyces sp. NPDC056503]|uniref:FG-GAP repeat domain-containing protein n=1 Tax=Streptomyces sp. NPDC056503 TaxID=3345842 RepID=UPI00369CDEF7